MAIIAGFTFFSVEMCLNSDSFISGLASTTFLNSRCGSCSKTSKIVDHNCFIFILLTKPSHKMLFSHTRFWTSFAKMVGIKLTSSGQIVMDWMAVRMKKIGIGSSSTNCCNTLDKTFFLKMLLYFSKHNLATNSYKKTQIYKPNVIRWINALVGSSLCNAIKNCAGDMGNTW